MNYIELLHQNLNFSATEDQSFFLQEINDFLNDKNPDILFLLKGYAGTGKTTLISTLVNTLRSKLIKTKLLAPTGRAAKVMTSYSQQKAYTIHKEIYQTVSDSSSKISFSLKENKARNTLFIVDEASMIADGNSFSGDSLLQDLIQYVYSAKGCKLILVGDTGQLPPINYDNSPALDAENLEFNYQKSIYNVELKQVVRQTERSNILKIATELRDLQKQNQQPFKINLDNGTDVIRCMDRYDVESALIDTIQNQIEDSVVVVRSNKRANLYNQQIRARILDVEEELICGDRLMILKNNYHWVSPNSKINFIANGDIVVVDKVFDIEEIYGFKFAHVSMIFPDYPDEKPIDVTLILDTIYADTPALSYDQWMKLYHTICEDYEHLSKRDRFLKLKTNKYLHALQVKFAYAITCHKSQGGQWKNVVLEKPYVSPEDQYSKNYYRWLYTAITRAKEKLYLIGFRDEFFD